MKYHFNRRQTWVRTLAVLVLCLFLTNNIAYAMGPRSASDTLSPSLRSKTMAYIAEEDGLLTVVEKRFSDPVLVDFFHENFGFMYLSRLIGQVFESKERGYLNKGLFKTFINGDMTHSRMALSRFDIEGLTMEGDTVCLPYASSKAGDDRRPFLRYYIASHDPPEARGKRYVEISGDLRVICENGEEPVSNIGTEITVSLPAADTDDGTGSRGVEGLPNEVYTTELKTAIDDGNILPMEMQYRHAYLVPSGRFRHETKGDIRAITAARGWPVMEKVNLAVERLSDEDKQLLGTVRTIFFKGRRKAHYGLARNQIYVNAKYAKDPGKLAAIFHHELQERKYVIDRMDIHDPEWRDKRAEEDIREKINEFAAKKHDELREEEKALRPGAPVYAVFFSDLSSVSKEIAKNVRRLISALPELWSLKRDGYRVRVLYSKRTAETRYWARPNYEVVEDVYTQGVSAAKLVGKLARRHGFSAEERDSLEFIAYEIACNVLEYGDGGVLGVRLLKYDGVVTGIEVVGWDRGPGIEDPEALRVSSEQRYAETRDGIGFWRLAHDADDVTVESMGRCWEKSVLGRFDESDAASDIVRGARVEATVFRHDLAEVDDRAVQTLPNVTGNVEMPEVGLHYRVSYYEADDDGPPLIGIVAFSVLDGRDDSYRGVRLSVQGKKLIIHDYFPIGHSELKDKTDWRRYHGKGISQTVLFWISSLARSIGVEEIEVSTPFLQNAHVFSKYFATHAEINGNTYSVDDPAIFTAGVMGRLQLFDPDTYEMTGNVELEHVEENRYRVVRTGLRAPAVDTIVTVNKGFVYGADGELAGLASFGIDNDGKAAHIDFRGRPVIPENVATGGIEPGIPAWIIRNIRSVMATGAKGATEEEIERAFPSSAPAVPSDGGTLRALKRTHTKDIPDWQVEGTRAEWKVREGTNPGTIRCDMRVFKDSAELGHVGFTVEKRGIVLYSCADLKIQGDERRTGLGSRMLLKGIMLAAEEAGKRGMDVNWTYVYYTPNSDGSEGTAVSVLKKFLESLGFSNDIAVGQAHGDYYSTLAGLIDDYPDPADRIGSGFWFSRIDDVRRRYAELEVAEDSPIAWTGVEVVDSDPVGEEIQVLGDAEGDFTLMVRVLHKGQEHYGKMVLTPEEEERFLVPEALIMKRLKTLKVEGVPRAEHFLELENGKKIILFKKFPPGRTLHDVVDEDGDLGRERAVEVMVKVSHIVEDLNANGIFHWDIKPANIWITNDGEVILFDLDLAFSTIEEFRARERFSANTSGFESRKRFVWRFSGAYDDEGSFPHAEDEVYSLGRTLLFILNRLAFDVDNIRVMPYDDETSKALRDLVVLTTWGGESDIKTAKEFREALENIPGLSGTETPVPPGSPLGVFNFLLKENRTFTESEISSGLRRERSSLAPDFRALVNHLGLARSSLEDGEPAYEILPAARAQAPRIIAILTELQNEHGYRPKVEYLAATGRDIETAIKHLDFNRARMDIATEVQVAMLFLKTDLIPVTIERTSGIKCDRSQVGRTTVEYLKEGTMRRAYVVTVYSKDGSFSPQRFVLKITVSDSGDYNTVVHESINILVNEGIDKSVGFSGRLADGRIVVAGRAYPGQTFAEWLLDNRTSTAWVSDEDIHNVQKAIAVESTRIWLTLGRRFIRDPHQRQYLVHRDDENGGFNAVLIDKGFFRHPEGPGRFGLEPEENGELSVTYDGEKVSGERERVREFMRQHLEDVSEKELLERLKYNLILDPGLHDAIATAGHVDPDTEMLLLNHEEVSPFETDMNAVVEGVAEALGPYEAGKFFDAYMASDRREDDIEQAIERWRASYMGVRFDMPEKIETVGEALDVLFNNETNARKFFAMVSGLRQVFPYDMTKNDPRAPLEYALDEGIYYRIGPNLFMTPVTESFRRHIVFSLDAVGDVKFAFEVMMPGEREGKRNVRADERYSISQDLISRSVGTPLCEKPIFKKEFPHGQYRFYGGSVTFNEACPLRIMAYEYTADGKRLEFVTPSMMEDIAKRTGMAADEVTRSIAAQAAGLMASVYAAGYVGHVPELRENTDWLRLPPTRIIHHDLHVSNMRLIMESGAVRVTFAGDFESYSRQSEYTDLEEEKAVDMRMMIFGIRGTMPGLADVTGMDIVELRQMIDRAFEAEEYMRTQGSARDGERGDPASEEEAVRVLTAVGSFSHGTNKATEVRPPIGNAFMNSRVVRDEVLKEESLSAYHEEVKAIYESVTAASDIIVNTHDESIRAIGYMRNDGVLPEAREVAEWKADVKKAYGLLVESRSRFNDIVEKLRTGLDLSNHMFLDFVMTELERGIPALEDRILLMDGRVSDEVFDLREIMENFYGELAGVSELDFREHFRIEIPDGPLLVRGNRSSVISLMCNLAVNGHRYAKEHMGDAARVTVSARRDGDKIKIVVSDNGAGIARDDLADIWKPFWSTTGGGIGLTEARLIAKDHGGGIDVESRHLGDAEKDADADPGTVFTASLAGSEEEGQYSRDEKEVEDFLNAVLYRVSRMEGEENIIIGLDTSWIPAEQLSAVQGLLNSLSHMQRKKGMGKIIVRRRSRPADLVRALLEEHESDAARNPIANMVIIGAQKVLSPPEGFVDRFKPLRDPSDGKEGAFFGEIVIPETGFPAGGLIELPSWIRQAVEKNFGSGKDKRLKFRPARSYDVGELKKIYELYRDRIRCAA